MLRPLRRLTVAAVLGSLLATGALAASDVPSGGAATASAAPATHVAEDVVIQSLAEDAIDIALTVFRPAGSSADRPVPMLLHSHGWGGSRTTEVSEFQAFLDAGFGVLSIDQRGHGETGGKANVEDPDLEGFDQLAINDYVASLEWVAKEDASEAVESPDCGPGRGKGKGLEKGAPGKAVGLRCEDGELRSARAGTDPLMGAIGGSYGGGYQFLNAFMDVLVHGDSRLDAIAPEITWYDLNQSLAPDDTPRTAWLTALTGAGAAQIRMADYIVPSFAYGAATGQYPDGTVPGTFDLKSEFAQHSPRYFVEDLGLKLDIPALIGQGHNDNLFNFNQGWDNYTRSFTPDARSQSLLIGYNGGHALPNAYPVGQPEAGLSGPDACSGEGGFAALSIRFFQMVFSGGDTQTLLPAPVNLSTPDGRCIHLPTLRQTDVVEVGPISTAGNTTGAGAAINIPLVDGPVTVAGIATLEGALTTLGADARVFVALSKGATPATAQVIQNNMLPIRELLPVSGKEIAVDLPGIAVDVAEGESLFLTITPVSDMYFAHGSRTPGVLIIEDAKVRLPLTAR